MTYRIKRIKDVQPGQPRWAAVAGPAETVIRYFEQRESAYEYCNWHNDKRK